MNLQRSFPVLLFLLLAAAPAAGAAATSVVKLDVPDVELVDQTGASRSLVSDRIGDRMAVITFTYADCTTICPALHGIFGALQRRWEGSLGDDRVLLTVTLDPKRDVPERLAQHAGHHQASAGWQFLTGDPAEVEQLLKKIEVFAAEVDEHAPTVFVVDGSRGVWTRINGFPTPDEIEQVMERYERARHDDEVARSYFSDVPLVTHEGKTVRFYSDVLRGRIVLLSTFFTHCEGVTPRQAQVLSQLQKLLGDELEQQFVIVSITIDPERDDVASIREFAGELDAGPGWVFLTGDPAEVHALHQRLGQDVENLHDHRGTYLMGNVETTLWMKVPAHAMARDLYRQLRILVADEGDAAAS